MANEKESNASIVQSITLLKYCPVCGNELEQKDEKVDGVTIKIWICHDCGFEMLV